MTMIKVIRIDSAERRIHEVEIESDNTEHICEQVGCRLFDIVRLENGDAIFIDDEGLLTATDQNAWFAIDEYNGILVGNGLVIGSNDMGEGVDAKTTIEDLENRIKFGKLVEVDGRLLPIYKDSYIGTQKV